MSRPSTQPLPVPTTGLEAALVTISQSLAEGYVGGLNGYEWALLYNAVVRGDQLILNANTDFYRMLTTRPKVYELLKPFIRLSKMAQQRLLAGYAVAATGESNQEKQEVS